MSITNGYTSLAALKSELSITDTNDDVRLERAISAASRQIDGRCGRRFWQDGSTVARTFTADNTGCLELGGRDDISTTTGLVVKVDYDGDGTFETTLTINTDFIVTPVNAASDTPVWPYTGLQITPTTSAYLPTNLGRPGVQITAKWGWPAVPDDITQACLIQAKNLYKATSGTFSGFQLSVDAGVVMRTPGFDAVAAALCEPFVTGWCG